MCATQRQKRNRISTIFDTHGKSFSNEDGIALCFTQHYQELFTSSKSLRIDECLSTLSPKLSTHMNTQLCQPFSVLEVKEVFFR